MAEEEKLRQIKQEIYDQVGNEYTVLGQYLNPEKNSHRIRIQHNKCGRQYLVKPDHFLSGERCPYCTDNDQ